MVERALVTGVTGFIGSHLAERLLAEGIAVRGLARHPDAAGWLARRGAEIVAGDLLDSDSLRQAVVDCQAILHAAAWTGGPGLSDQEAWDTNVTATGNLLDAAKLAGATRFIFFSSVAVYGVNSAALIDETVALPAVGQLYPDSKIAAERLVSRAHGRGLPTTIIRPASTYGPRGTAWTLNIVQQIKAGRMVLFGADAGLVNTGYIDNVVDGVWLALNDPNAIGETFNLCDGSAVTYRQFYERYAIMLGPGGLSRLRTWPAWLARGAATPAGRLARRLLRRPPVGPWSYHFRFNPSLFSIDKARRLLNYRPRIGFEAGMQLTEAWLRAGGYLS